MKNPETGKRVSRINPPEEWIIAEVPELRILGDELWQAAKARQGEIAERLSAAPVDLPDIHPNIAIVYRRKMERLAEALAAPRDRDEAADAIRGLIERIVLTPGEKRGEMDAALHGDLGTILEWAGSGRGKGATDTPARGMSVSVVAGARFVGANPR